MRFNLSAIAVRERAITLFFILLLAAAGAYAFFKLADPDARALIAGLDMRSDLESLLARSFPNPGDDDKIRELFRASVGNDFLDIKARREGDLIVYGFPVAVLVSER